MPLTLDRRDLLTVASAGAMASAAPAVFASPVAPPKPDAGDQHMRWWRAARLGALVTFGPNSLIGSGDWAMAIEDIGVPEYEAITARFQPKPGCAREWARLAREAGLKYVVLVAKFHDGYCLWDSKLTNFNSAKVGPRRDIVREFVEAVRGEGLKVGIYFSLLDWHHPDGLRSQFDPAARERFVGFTHGQLRELLTNYGEVSVLWYDVGVPLDAAGWRSEEINAMARSLQPGIVINHRNWLPGDFATSEQEVSPKERDWEVCMTVNESWFYTRGDDLWKSPREIASNVVRAAQFGGNFMLNIGPMPDGSVPAQSAAAMRAFGAWVERNSEAIYSTTRSAVRYSKIAGFTRHENTLYTHVHFWPGETVAIGGIKAPPKRAWLVASGKPVRFTHDGSRLKFVDLPLEAPDPVTTVIGAEFERFPEQDSLASRTAARLHALYKETGIAY